VTFDVLPHLQPEVGGGDFNIGFVSCVVSFEDAVMGLPHDFLSVTRWYVERCSRVIEIIQPGPDDLILVLEEFVDHGRVVGLILFWYTLRPLISVPECLNALQDFFLHLSS